MAAKATHVIPVNGHWIVKKSGAQATGVFASKKEATSEALRIAKAAKAGQVAVHNTTGMFSAKALHGLPKVQTSPHESEIGTRAIKTAIRQSGPCPFDG